MLLVSFLGTGTAAVPAVVSLAAGFCGGHSVLVMVSAGGAQVVLHHEAECFTPRTDDHESELLRGIVRMCQPDRAGDHCLSAARITSGYERAGDDVFQPQAREASLPAFEHASPFAKPAQAASPGRRELAIATDIRGGRTGSAAMMPLLI